MLTAMRQGRRSPQHPDGFGISDVMRWDSKIFKASLDVYSEGKRVFRAYILTNDLNYVRVLNDIWDLNDIRENSECEE